MICHSIFHSPSRLVSTQASAQLLSHPQSQFPVWTRLVPHTRLPPLSCLLLLLEEEVKVVEREVEEEVEMVAVVNETPLHRAASRSPSSCLSSSPMPPSLSSSLLSSPFSSASSERNTSLARQPRLNMALLGVEAGGAVGVALRQALLRWRVLRCLERLPYPPSCAFLTAGEVQAMHCRITRHSTTLHCCV